MKRINLFSFIILVCFISNYPQDLNNFEAMRNAFLMGLDSKGLDICHNIISNKSNPEREKSLFYIAEYFLSKSFEDSAKSINKAYTFYEMYEFDYKNGAYISVVKERKSYLESYYSEQLQLVDYLNKNYNEETIVERKLKILESFFHFNLPKPFDFYSKNENAKSGLDLVERYCDDIILNHPNFAIVGHYIKTIAYLSQLSGNDFIQDGIFDFKTEKILNYDSYPQNVKKFLAQKEKIYNIIKIIDDKFPHHYLTLNLHLILSNVFFQKKDGKIDSSTLANLEYVLKNSPKLSFENTLVKEFILKNQFESKPELNLIDIVLLIDGTSYEGVIISNEKEEGKIIKVVIQDNNKVLHEILGKDIKEIYQK